MIFDDDTCHLGDDKETLWKVVRQNIKGENFYCEDESHASEDPQPACMWTTADIELRTVDSDPEVSDRKYLCMACFERLTK